MKQINYSILSMFIVPFLVFGMDPDQEDRELQAALAASMLYQENTVRDEEMPGLVQALALSQADTHGHAGFFAGLTEIPQSFVNALKQAQHNNCIDPENLSEISDHVETQLGILKSLEPEVTTDCVETLGLIYCAFETLKNDLDEMQRKDQRMQRKEDLNGI